MTIPFFPPDLFADDRETLLDLVHRIGTGPEQKFLLGEQTARFEEALAASLGDTGAAGPAGTAGTGEAVQVVACSSGTSALTLVLHAMGIGPGDEVVVPAYGCAPLANTVVLAGARPVFADVDPWTMVADPDAVEKAVTDRTRAVMPAHMFSVMADMPRMREIAARHGVRLIEDSAVAQGGVLDGRPAGTWGDAGVFSFVQVKTFGTAGEGGAVVTRDPELAAAVRSLRNHGQSDRFVYPRTGHNSRFDEVLAAFQLHRLPAFPALLERRARIADHYTARFAPLRDRGLTAPPPGRNGRCFYVYSLLADDRDGLREHLAEHGVDSHVYYPQPLPHQAAFARFAPPGGSWPHAESAARRQLAIPVHPRLTDAQVEHIADTVCGYYAAPRHP